MDNQETEPMDLQSGADAIAGLMDDKETKDQGGEDSEDRKENDVDNASESLEEDAGGEAEEEPLDTEPKYKVKVNGEDKLVSLPDALKGYMMQQDYTKKTQELATKEQALAQQIRTDVSQAYTQRLREMDALLKAAVRQDQQIDWDTLAREDPATYVQKQHEAQQRQYALQQLQSQQQQEAHRNLEENLAREKTKLLERRPEWSDSKKAQEDFAAMQGYLAKDYGFSEQEINSVIDNRQLDIVWKASQYDKLQAAKPAVTKKVEKLPVKTERPGVASDGVGKKSAIDKLRRSGRVEDAQAAIRGLMG